MRLAGIDISEAGLSYLNKDLRLADKPIVFNIIKETDGNPDSIDGDVTVKKVFHSLIIKLSTIKFILECYLTNKCKH